MICPKCKYQNSSTNIYCAHCGYKLNENQAKKTKRSVFGNKIQIILASLCFVMLVTAIVLLISGRNDTYTEPEYSVQTTVRPSAVSTTKPVSTIAPTPTPTPKPTLTPEPTPTPSPAPDKEMFLDWMEDLDYKVQIPDDSSYLPSLRQAIVKSKYGAGINARNGPGEDYAKFSAMVVEGEKVTVMAVERNCALIRVNNSGRVVWVSNDLLKYE